MTSHGAGLLTVVNAQRIAQSPIGSLIENCGAGGAFGSAGGVPAGAAAGGGALGAGAAEAPCAKNVIKTGKSISPALHRTSMVLHPCIMPALSNQRPRKLNMDVRRP